MSKNNENKVVVKDVAYNLSFFPRVDNGFGDRNLICSCPSIEEYALEEA